MSEQQRPVSAPTLVYTDVSSGALRARGWRVRVVAGADAGAERFLEAGSLMIGSGSGNDLVLVDPRVSRDHLELRLREHGLQVRDLGSTNGTYLGTARLTDSLLEDASQLKLGSTQLALEPWDREVEVDVSAERLGELVGADPAMRQLFGAIMQVAPSSATVLLEGETGTGKEQLADQLHRHSQRSEGPFVIVDCGALAGGLVESELFGHVRGAFTGAVGNREGAFEAAHGGTLFLDEIGELMPDLQPRLLRVLEQGTVRRVGDNNQTSVDVRVIAATSRDLADEVKQSRFRADLYYRLAVVRLRVPPLRERLGDLPLLARTLCRRVAGQQMVIPEAVLKKLAAHDWPGNVRELRNVLAHAITLRPHEPVLELAGPLERALDEAGAAEELPSDYREAKALAMADFEVRYLEQLLDKHSWNISAAAREAGVDRNYLHRLIKRHGLQRD